ncbi:MAG: 5-dehydro-4-deoxy-D-glucuronate isomerase [Bacteroidetes bacterium]|nr:5-dehydro-4-deoxy-D-glucuronate isomerase [Bacteroidota bacterium]
MEVRYSPDQTGFARMSTNELRKSFLIDQLFVKNKIPMIYSEIDRSITGSAVPVGKKLELKATKKEMAANYFAERREVGVINIGGNGTIQIDKKNYSLKNRDAIYIGRGTKKIVFESKNAKAPAQFYFVSYPAHAEYPTVKVTRKNTSSVNLGSLKNSNDRIIYKYIHPGNVQTCQLVMGLTELNEGSVWNTMPAHTHQRRSEVYMYFDLSKEDVLVHLIGAPSETRHIIMRDRQAVLSPSWSLHSAAGTKNYSFIWAMGGENQVFDDMDFIPMDSLL